MNTKTITRILRKLVCLIAGHRFNSWSLGLANYPDGIVKDITSRSCACGKRECLIIPFRQFIVTKSR